jgi:Ca2+/Na+ antiporter
MGQQFISTWHTPLLGEYPLEVLIIAFQFGGLLAFGLNHFMATRTLIFRDNFVMLPAWITGMGAILIIFQETSMWPGLLVLLQLGAMLFAYWSYKRWMRQQKR